MLADFLDMQSSLIVTMHVQSVDQVKAIRTIKRKITDLQKMTIEEQKKAVRAGYDMDIIPSDLATYGNEAKKLLQDLQSRNERMFLLTFLVLNVAETKQQLENNVFQAGSIAQKYNCQLTRLDFQQEEGLMSSLPLGLNQVEIERGMTTSSVAIFVPFTTQELFQSGKEALYCGINALSNNLIMVDRKLLKNPNGLILGTPGSGKSFAAKREIAKEACWTVSNVREILKRREYTGVMVMNQRHWKGLDNPRTVWTDESEWQIIPDCHEAIVSESEYEEAQKVFRKIRKGYDRSPDQYLLRSLVHCGACGRTMQRQKHSPVVYYTCLKSVSNRETACPVGERFIEADLERIVKNDLLEKLRLLVDADDRLYAAAAASEGTEENLRFRMEQIEKRLKQISVGRISAYERYAEGRLQRDIYLIERDKMNTESDSLSEEKERLEKELLSLSQSKNRELTETCGMARRTLTADELTNEMLLFFIDRVNVYSGMRVEIIYRFSDEIARLIGQENTAE